MPAPRVDTRQSRAPSVLPRASGDMSLVRQYLILLFVTPSVLTAQHSRGDLAPRRPGPSVSRALRLLLGAEEHPMLWCEPVGAAAAAPVVDRPMGGGDPGPVIGGLGGRAVRWRLRRRGVRWPFEVTGLGGGDTRPATRLPLHTLSLRGRYEWERDQADEQDQTLHGTPPSSYQEQGPGENRPGPVRQVDLSSCYGVVMLPKLLNPASAPSDTEN